MARATFRWVLFETETNLFIFCFNSSPAINLFQQSEFFSDLVDLTWIAAVFSFQPWLVTIHFVDSIPFPYFNVFLQWKQSAAREATNWSIPLKNPALHHFAAHKGIIIWSVIAISSRSSRCIIFPSTRKKFTQ